MAGFRGNNRQPIVHAMIASLVFYSMLVAWQVPAMALARALAPDIPAQATILCTANGLRVVLFDASGDPVGDSQLPGSAEACPICQGVAGAVTPLAAHPPEIGVPIAWSTLTFTSEQVCCRPGPVLIRRGHDPPSSS